MKDEHTPRLPSSDSACILHPSSFILSLLEPTGAEQVAVAGGRTAVGTVALDRFGDLAESLVDAAKVVSCAPGPGAVGGGFQRARGKPIDGRFVVALLGG